MSISPQEIKDHLDHKDAPQAPQESLQETLEIIAEIVTASRDMLQGDALRDYVAKGMLDRVLEILGDIEVGGVVEEVVLEPKPTPGVVINRTLRGDENRLCYFEGGPLAGVELLVPIDLDIVCIPASPEYLYVDSIDQLKGLLPQDHWHRYTFRRKLNGEASDVFEYTDPNKDTNV